MTFPQDLKPGDILLYSSADLVDRLIEWKEADSRRAVAHIEIYSGDALSWASRNGIGVSRYPFRADGLVVVRRPCLQFDPHGTASEWFAKMNGDKYGWPDILSEIGFRSKTPPEAGAEDCSHFAAMLLEAMSCPQFDPLYPKQNITPDDFQKVRESVEIWIST